MAQISELFVELKLVADNFNNGLKASQKEANEFAKTMKPLNTMLADTGKALTGIGASISVVGGVFALGAKSAIDLADSLDEMADRTGASVEALSSIGHQVKLAGGSLEGMEKAMRASSKVLEDAASGSKTAAASFEKLGLNTDVLLKMNVDQRFFAIAEALHKIEDPGLKSALAMETFGRAGTELIPALGELAKGQDAVMASASALGQTISTQTAKSANE